MTLKVAFIGLGAMGEPMAGHLKQHGVLYAVANRTHAKAQALARALGVAAPPLAELARQCEVIALCVTADADVLNAIDSLAPHVKPDAIVIDHSTIAPDTAREAARRLAAVSAHFLDAPVSGGVEGARQGRLSIMVGGDAALFDRVQPVLGAYAVRITHLGDVGAGQAAKAVNQVLVAGIAQAVCEGLALGEALGLDPQRLLPALSAGAAGNWFLDKRGATMLKNQFNGGATVALLHKDLSIARDMAAHAGTARVVIEESLADIATLMEQGCGEEDISSLIRLKRRP